jgi:hypothetical protein
VQTSSVHRIDIDAGKSCRPGLKTHSKNLFVLDRTPTTTSSPPVETFFLFISRKLTFDALPTRIESGSRFTHLERETDTERKTTNLPSARMATVQKSMAGITAW